ncbi:hypothetical protein FTV88_2866 [Heliorestis convoluta]|uniref:Uncharacterized protein n=1 Tax=Heliorestis convoluta TaxID=356322 RepID=A0A5Q2N8Y6_9FIRM|nr:hypothetical protein FTV88_2866 [Heliorestis convoluta]
MVCGSPVQRLPLLYRCEQNSSTWAYPFSPSHCMPILTPKRKNKKTR